MASKGDTHPTSADLGRFTAEQRWLVFGIVATKFLECQCGRFEYRVGRQPRPQRPDGTTHTLDSIFNFQQARQVNSHLSTPQEQKLLNLKVGQK